VRVVALALLIALAPLAEARAASVVVRVGGDDGARSLDAFAPTPVTVDAGDTVEWVNVGTDTPHTVTATGANGSFDSSPTVTSAFLSRFGDALAPGQSFAHTFTAPGTITVRCKLHRGMVETIVVAPANGTPAASDVAAVAGWADGNVSVQSFSPPTLDVRVGDRVVWTDRALDEIHTVTATDGSFDSSPGMTNASLAASGVVERSPGGFLLPGGSYAFTFTTPGVYAYACKLHASMRGTVVVQAAAARAIPSPGVALTLAAASLSLGCARARGARSSRGG
jgi:plastocyanin